LETSERQLKTAISGRLRKEGSVDDLRRALAQVRSIIELVTRRLSRYPPHRSRVIFLRKFEQVSYSGLCLTHPVILPKHQDSKQYEGISDAHREDRGHSCRKYHTLTPGNIVNILIQRWSIRREFTVDLKAWLRNRRSLFTKGSNFRE
jgi:hypothetical protein